MQWRDNSNKLMKKSIKTYKKEIFWSDLAGDFPDMTMKEAFQSEVKRCVGLGLMEHPPRQDMTGPEWKQFRANFNKRRQRAN